MTVASSLGAQSPEAGAQSPEPELYILSKIPAAPIPPPTHMVTMP